ncbi:MAG: hypothetical protein K5669_10855 [Lachnospiraceae bacterium]|nr:hypothetical protein [Lachnospiraceae bacterium]
MEQNVRPVKKIVKHTVSIVVFALIVFFVIGVTYNVLRWKDTNGDYVSSVEQLKATDDNLIDVVFAGTSHVYCGVNPAVFWEQKGWACFDMSTSGQDVKSTYYHLKNLLKNQSPKVVYVDLYGILSEKHGVEGNIYRNYLSMPFSKNSIEHINSYFPKGEREDYYFRFPIIHTRYRELKKYDYYEYKPNRYLRGEHISWNIGESYEPEITEGVLNPGELEEWQINWLNDMQSLAREKEFELVFIVLPSFTTFEHQKVYDAVAVYCEENGIGFMDLNRVRTEIGIVKSTDFEDAGHLNAYGAEKVGMYMMGQMEEYGLADHRGDKDYYQWDLDLDEYNAGYEYSFIEKDADLSGLVGSISRNEDYISVVSLEGDYVAVGQPFYEPLSYLNMTYDDYEKGGKWIYEDGCLTKVLENDLEAEEYVKDLNRFDSLRIKYRGDYLFPDNIMINGDTYYNNGCHLCILVYDKKRGEVVAYRRF